MNIVIGGIALFMFSLNLVGMLYNPKEDKFFWHGALYLIVAAICFK